jgi:hypothetical protein
MTHSVYRTCNAIGEDMVAYECDYPHSDSLWPKAPETLWDSVKHLTEAQIDKVTHRNAMRFFRFDPFKHFKREELTVGALRAQAAGVDLTDALLWRRGAAAAGREAAAHHLGRCHGDVQPPSQDRVKRESK